MAIGRQTRRRFVGLLAALGVAPLADSARTLLVPGEQPAEAVSVVASGLVNPRGFAFAPDGTLHVALGGRIGATAGVVAITDGCPVPVVDGFPTALVAFNAPVGVADVAFLGDRLYALAAGGDVDRGRQPNGLYLIENGAATLVADVSAFIRDNPVAEKPRDYDTDGQPHAMVPDGDGFLVTEGNSNQLLRVGIDGRVERVADLSRGHPIPTGLAPTPAEEAYVGYLTSGPYTEGTAKVSAVSAEGTVTDAWTGLTLITALAVDGGGGLYALEMATGYGDDPAAIGRGSGRIVRQTGPDAAEVVVGGLDLPVAMEFGPDGALYVATPAFGADGGEGVILRLELTDGGPVVVPAGAVGTGRCG